MSLSFSLLLLDVFTPCTQNKYYKLCIQYALDVILHQRAKLKFKGRQNQQRPVESILEASVGAVTPVSEKLSAKDHLITSPVSDSRPARARMERGLLTNENNSTPDPAEEYHLRNTDMMEPAPCRRLEMTLDKDESEEDLTDEEPVNVVQTDDVHVEELELCQSTLPAEDHSSKVDTLLPTCSNTNGLSENHHDVDHQHTTGAKLFEEFTPSEGLDNFKTGPHDASKRASVEDTETVVSGTVTNGVCASSTMQGTGKIDASSSYRCTSVFFALTAALAVLAVLLEVSMSSYQGQTSTVLPVSGNPRAGPMSFHASWEALSSLFRSKRPTQVLVEDHTDVSDMDLTTMQATSQAAGRDGDDL
jgi:hypothetical protein